MKAMTVAELRAILADAPDDAPIQINPVFAGEEPGEHPPLTVMSGEVLETDRWYPNAGIPTPLYVFLVADEDPATWAEVAE